MRGATVCVAALSAVSCLTFLTDASRGADLGGNCCADLEERIAELETTVARKGNNKVSLQVTGQVSMAIMAWNDGGEANTYVVENDSMKNLLRFAGAAKINSDWSAGFRLEVQIRAYRSSSATQLAQGASQDVSTATFETRSLALRHANWYLESRSWGRFTVGRDNDAISGIARISLVDPDGFGAPMASGDLVEDMYLRRSGTVGNAGLSQFSWNSMAMLRNTGPTRTDYSSDAALVKYTSPFVLGQTRSTGMQLQAAWGMDDFWSVALRYTETFGAFRIAAGIGMSDVRAVDRAQCSRDNSNLPIPVTPGDAAGSSVSCQSYGASASLMHVPTGLFVSAGGAQVNDQNVAGAAGLASVGAGSVRQGADGKFGYWWVQAGWRAKLNSFGNTIFWGQYNDWNTGLGVENSRVQNVPANDPLNSLGTTALIAGSSARAWGLGVTQTIDAANMNLYLGFYSYSTDVMLWNQNAGAAVQMRRALAIDDMNVLYSGATIRF